jgi:hypothetical protein
MLRLSLKPTHAHSEPPARKPAAIAVATTPVGPGGCGYRLEAASRRAGLGSAFGRDRGQKHDGIAAAPR